MKKCSIWNYIGLIIGILAIVVGIVFLFAFREKAFLGSYIRLGTSSFGGDFYTYSYRATAFAANAIAGVYEMLATCFGVLFILIGCIDISFFGLRISLQPRAVSDSKNDGERPEYLKSDETTTQETIDSNSELTTML